MAVLTRRLTIITLMMTVFALAFAALVQADGRKQARVHPGTTMPCYHPATPNCTIAL